MIQHPELPLPNPDCLRIHAACSKVTRLSGATGYVEETMMTEENEAFSQERISWRFSLQQIVQ